MTLPLDVFTLTPAEIDAELTAEGVDTLLAIPAATGGYFDLLMMPSAVTVTGGPFPHHSRRRMTGGMIAMGGM